MRSASRTPRDNWGGDTWRSWQEAHWTNHRWKSQSSSSWGWKEPSWDPQRWDSDSNWDTAWNDTTWKSEEATEVPEPWYLDAHDLTMNPSGEHKFTMILLHSCSGGPDDWIPIIHRLNVPFRNEIRFAIPCAPLRKESHNLWKGEMNSWFEYGEDGESAEDPQELMDQVERIHQLMQEEIAILPGQDPKRLLLGGFSQGVALVVEAALSFESKTSPLILLRGAALSSGHTATEEELHSTQVLAHHGKWDRLCSAESALRSYQQRLKGAELRMVVDETLGHACARGRQQLCAGEFQQICDFLLEIWGPMTDSSSDSA